MKRTPHDPPIPQSPSMPTPESAAKVERLKKLSPVELGDRVKKLWDRKSRRTR